MKCIVFQINGKIVPVEMTGTDSASPTLNIENENSILIKDSGLTEENFNLDAVVEELIKPENEQIKKALINSLSYNYSETGKTVTIDKLEKEGFTSNYTTSDLKWLFNYIVWVDPDEVLDLLILHDFKVDGKKFQGRYLKGGKEIFIVNDDSRSLKEFNKFLRVRKAIRNDNNVDNSFNDIIAIAKEKFPKKQIKTKKDLLYDFIFNKEAYNKVLTLEQFNYLDRWLKTYQGEIISEDNDDFSVELRALLRGKKDNFIKLNRKSLKTLSKKYFKDDFDIDTDEGIEELISLKYKTDLYSDVDYTLYEINKDNIIFQMNYNKIVDDSTISLQELNDENFLKEVEEYRGYTIYEFVKNGRTKYVISSDPISEYTSGRYYDTIEQAKKYADIQQENFGRLDNAAKSKVDFKFERFKSKENSSKFYSSQNFKVGSLIKVLNIELDKDIKEQVDLFIKKYNKLQTFYEYYAQQLTEELKLQDSEKENFYNKVYEKLRTILDNIEKAVAFQYLVTKSYVNDSSNATLQLRVDSALESIKNAGYKYYIINDRYGAQYDLLEYPGKRIYFDEKYSHKDDKTESRGRYAISIQVLTELCNKFKSRFGVDVEIKTDEEMKDESGGEVGVRAMIKNGKIYINGSTASTADMYHELAHLILGTIKIKNPELYEKLLYDFIKKINDPKVKDGIIIKAALNKIKSYTGITEMDRAEELFADIFGQHLSGKLFDNMFEETGKILEEESNDILNDFEIPKGNIYQIVGKVASLAKGGLNYKRSAVSRKISTKINELINNEQLEEICE